jgi:hypothetical protein
VTATLNGRAARHGVPNSRLPNGAAANGRSADGKFAQGNPGGPGRKPVRVEQTYLATMVNVVSADDWRAITERAVADARQGDAAARSWLSAYLLGVPQKVAPTNAEAVAAALFGHGLDAVLVEMARHACRLQNEFGADRPPGFLDALREVVAGRLGLTDRQPEGASNG